MKNNFDELIDRHNMNSSKYDELFQIYKEKDIRPFTVADMDFKTDENILKAIIAKVNKGILAYTSTPIEYFLAYKNWYKKQHNYDFDEKCMLHCPGVISGLRVYINYKYKKNTKFLILEPMYASFKRIVENSSMKMLTSNLIKDEQGKWQIDYSDFEEKIKQVKVLIFCNPQNPIGKCWTESEIKYIAKMCEKYKVDVISDEIHADLVLFSNKHIPFRKYYNNTVTFYSITKTFNLSGLQSAICILNSVDEKNKVFNEWKKMDIYRPNAIAVEAVIEACKNSEPWLLQLKKYIEANFLFLDKYLKENLVDFEFTIPDASYLAFISLQKLGISEEEIKDFFVKKVKMAVVPGSVFGDIAKGYIRVNVACPRSILEKYLKRIKELKNN